MSIVFRKDHCHYSEIWINRPESLNSINPEVLKCLLSEFSSVPESSKLVLLRTVGDKSFIAGADIKSMQQMSSEQLSNFAEQAHSLMNLIEKSEYLVIACIQGYAFGGGLELALACDIIIAAEQAKFSLPELNLGLIPGFGGTQRLLQKTNLSFTRKAIYTSEQISAETAKANNLVDYLVKTEEFNAEIERISKIILSKSNESIRATKRSIYEFNSNNLSQGLKCELEQFVKCFNSKNAQEGLRAFIEKRIPEFK